MRNSLLLARQGCFILVWWRCFASESELSARIFNIFIIWAFLTWSICRNQKYYEYTNRIQSHSSNIGIEGSPGQLYDDCYTLSRAEMGSNISQNNIYYTYIQYRLFCELRSSATLSLRSKSSWYQTPTAWYTLYTKMHNVRFKINFILSNLHSYRA